MKIIFNIVGAAQNCALYSVTNDFANCHLEKEANLTSVNHEKIRENIKYNTYVEDTYFLFPHQQFRVQTPHETSIEIAFYLIFVSYVYAK